MRRLTLLLLLALAAPAPAATLRITTPDTSVAAHPHASSLAAEVVIKGTAKRGALVELHAQCQLGPCRVDATANRKGRFSALLNVVLPRTQRNLRLRAVSGDREYAAAYPLSLPAYASVSPYSDAASVPELVMIGDSLAVGTDPPLRADLPGWRVTVDGRVGRPLAEGMSMLAMTPLKATPRALAFSLFTNDDPTHVTDLETAVDDSLLRLGGQDCALWATIVRPKVGGVSYDAANRRLRALAASDDRVVVVDWALAVKRHPGWVYRKDGVHGTVAGYAGRARLYAAAAERCADDNDWDEPDDTEGTGEGGVSPPSG